MTKQLLITLRPVDYYFFGGENTFDTDSKLGVRNYLVRSRKLPQQTSVLGLLRHILRINKLDFGPESFNADLGCQKTLDKNEGEAIRHQLFGILHSLSPIFLQYKQGTNRRFLLPASKLWLEDGEELEVNFGTDKKKGFRGDSWNDQVDLEYFDKNSQSKLPYTEKKKLGHFWIMLDNGKKMPEEFNRKLDTGIFSSNLHIGIDKMSRIKNSQAGDEEGFYKQEFVRLAPDFGFAVIATVEAGFDTNIFNCTMPFGGEQRTFIVKGEEWTPELQAKWTPDQAYDNHSDCIVLISDAFVEKPNELFKLCRFVMADSIPFRNIQIKEPEKGQQPTYDFENLHRSKRKTLLHLIEKGSVLFPMPGKEKAVLDFLMADCNFRNIGYNHFFTNQSVSITTP